MLVFKCDRCGFIGEKPVMEDTGFTRLDYTAHPNLEPPEGEEDTYVEHMGIKFKIINSTTYNLCDPCIFAFHLFLGRAEVMNAS
jgi:hypothetical protein